ncbi:MAG: sugar phosphate nucleotidyltransferase [Spirochaetota bacterium]
MKESLLDEKPVVLILAGGIGERFWPRSRKSLPKQLLKVYSNKTLLKETLTRALTITSIDRIFIGTNAPLKKVILEQEKNFPEKNFIIEPEGKNTAPIIALASLYFQKKFKDPVQVVLSADAFINPNKEFTACVKAGILEAKEHLVLLGVKPNRPETGYGYISVGKPTYTGFEVKSFFEKPDIKTAKKYIKRKTMYWNPGIFIWKTSILLEEMQKFAPYILHPLQKSFPFKRMGELAATFKKIPSEPIDKALMEKCTNIRMVKATFSWDDVGSWLSLARVIPEEEDGNYHVGKNVVYHRAEGNISSVKKNLIAFLGVDNLIVVEEDDVLLVTSQEGVQDMKVLISKLKKNRSLQKYLD